MLFRITFLGFLMLTSLVQAQVLSNWTYQDIVTDTEAGGEAYAMEIDGDGNIHCTFRYVMDESSDRLMYGKKNIATGQWTFESVYSGNAGIASSLKLDANNKVHIAFFANQQDSMRVRYATNVSGSWTVETPSNEGLGIYGFPEYPVMTIPSIDIDFTPQNTPFIVVFDGTIKTFKSNGYIPQNYDLGIRQYYKNTLSAWQTYPVREILAPATYAMGDRYGECLKLLRRPSGKYVMLTNSVYNWEGLSFTSDPSTFYDWQVAKFDSVERFYRPVVRDVNNNNPYALIASNPTTYWVLPQGIGPFFLPFEYIDVAIGNDSTFHAIYTFSEEYHGQGIRFPHSSVFYSKFNPDRLGQLNYQPFYYDFNPNSLPNNTGTRDAKFRSYNSIAALNKDTIATTTVNVTAEMVEFRISYNGGNSWALDTILTDFSTNSQTVSRIEGDSVYVMLYNTFNQAHLLASRHLSGGNWHIEVIQQREERGQYLGADIKSLAGGRKLAVSFEEKNLEKLYYAERIEPATTWTIDSVDMSGKQVRYNDVTLSPTGVPCVVYVLKEDEVLKAAEKNGGTWSYSVIDASTRPRELALTSHGNQLHLAYYDGNQGALKYATASFGSGVWTTMLIDSSSLICGRNPSIAVDSITGTVHIAYVDVSNGHVKHAFKTTSGTWQTELAVFSTDLYVVPNTSIQVDSLGTVNIVFFDTDNDKIYLNKKTVATGIWERDEIFNTVNYGPLLLASSPDKLILDKKGRAWILVNYPDPNAYGMRLVRQDSLGNLYLVSVLSNNISKISNSFDFQLVGDDFYILGRKNAEENRGIALLYSMEGVYTLLEELEQKTEEALLLYPNPASTSLTLAWKTNIPENTKVEILNIQGELVLTAFDGNTVSGEQVLPISVEGLAQGTYLCRVTRNGITSLHKWILTK